MIHALVDMTGYELIGLGYIPIVHTCIAGKYRGETTFHNIL